jgi:hypothetical protein
MLFFQRLNALTAQGKLILVVTLPIGVLLQLMFLIFIIFIIAISKNRRGGGNNGRGTGTNGTSRF